VKNLIRDFSLLLWGMDARTGLTFDDVLLVPRRSAVKSRKDVNVSTKLSRRIPLSHPIVSSNMDTVTEVEMAISMARSGGIGILHRFLPAEEQAKMVSRVKRAASYKIDTPYTTGADAKITELQSFMKEKGVHSILVVDSENKLLGIVTSRDLRFIENGSKVSSIMTPREKLICGDPEISIDKAKGLLSENRIEKLPLVDSNNTLKGLITAKDILNITQRPHASTDDKGRYLVGAAIGVKEGYLDRATTLVEAGVDALVVDVAHGHSDLAIDTVNTVKEKFPSVDIIAGNVATAEGTKDLIDAGADAIKVGVGPGSICITRVVTGSGVPQLTAIIDCAEEAAKSKIPIIADGGIRTSGDISKALAAGASSVMVGNLLAGTEESPGKTLMKDNRKVKVIRGMAGYISNMSKLERDHIHSDALDIVPEGVEGYVPYRGHTSDILNQLIGGLKSGISYCGSHNIEEMQKKSKFIRVTSAGKAESKSHDISKV
jgi:IMP dehydrogenase